MIKYSLGSLFVVVAIIALGCTAWMNFSQLWVEVMVALVLLSLSVALAAALAERSPARPFARGFAALGGAYFLVAFAMPLELRNERLLTERPVNWLYKLQQKVQPDAPDTSNAYLSVNPASTPAVGATGPTPLALDFAFPIGSTSGVTYSFVGVMPPAAPRIHPAPRELQDIGHCLWTLLVAGLGGALTQAIQRRKHRAEPSPGAEQ
jgi:hypothetical protein